MMSWDNAIFEAKRMLGHHPDEYVEDFLLVTEKAKELLKESRVKWHAEYRKYMNSKRWRTLRNSIIKNFNSECQDCGRFAECVHHKSYKTLYTKSEIFDCIPLCNICHMKRHNLQKGENENNVFTGRCSGCKKETLIFRVDSWSKQGTYGKRDYFRGGWFNFCNNCLTKLNFERNRKFNECTECFDEFIGRKNEAKCQFCRRRFF